MEIGISTHGNLNIILEKYIFYPGEQVRGSINIILKQTISPSTLYLRFKGVENSLLGPRLDDLKDQRMLKAQVSKTDYLLISWESPIEASHFSVPFSLLLPPSLPGSFSYLVPGILLRMHYKLKAFLKGPNVYIKTSQQLWIKNILSMQSPHEDHLTAKVIAWCFKKKGTIDVNIRWINDKYSPTTPLDCIIDIDNSKSKVTINAIKMDALCVTQAAFNRFQPRRYTIRMPLCQSTLKVDIKPGEKFEGDQGKRFIISFNSFPRLPQFLPKMCNFEGKLFNLKFFIEFELVLDNSCVCCGDRHVAVTSFILESEGRFELPNFVAPENWRPQVYRHVEVAYDRKLEVLGTHLGLEGKDEGTNLDQTKFS
jgi:hypothetical protein